MLTWAITRAAADAAPTLASLQASGVPALGLPCIERQPLPLSPWTAAGHRVAFFTSKAAVEAVLQSHGPAQAWRLDDVAAVAPSTAQALLQAGRPPTLSCPGGSEALALHVRAALGGHPDCVFWYPTSDAGLDTAEQTRALQALESLGPVDRPVAYRTVRPAALDEAVRALPPRVGVVFHSPSAVASFFASRPPRPPEAVLCVGASTWREALRHHPAALAVSPTQSVVEAIRRWSPAHA